MELKVIKTEEDYDVAINELERLIDLHPATGTSVASRLEVLSILIEKYEKQNFSFDIPDPISAIKFVMDQRNLKRDDLIPYLGSRSRVSEVLSGKRELSKKMMRALHKELGIPAEILIKEKGVIMAKPRNTYKYQFKTGNKIVHGGITSDLDRREKEHQQQWPSGKIKQVGRKTTEEGGRKWEKEKGYS